MVDVRDVADAAVIELLRRDRAPAALPPATYELAGPDALTGRSLATIWSEAAGIKIGMQQMVDRAWAADLCLVPPDASASETAKRRLAATADAAARWIATEQGAAGRP